MSSADDMDDAELQIDEGPSKDEIEPEIEPGWFYDFLEHISNGTYIHYLFSIN